MFNHRPLGKNDQNGGGGGENSLKRGQVRVHPCEYSPPVPFSSCLSAGPWEGPCWERLGTGAPLGDRGLLLFPWDQVKGTQGCGEDAGRRGRWGGGTPAQPRSCWHSMMEEAGEDPIQASGNDFLCLSEPMHVSDVFTPSAALCLLPSVSSDVYQEL